jgi:hypothetical protein
MKLLARLILKIGGFDLSWIRIAITGKEYALTAEDHTHLLRLFKKSNYIILTKRRWSLGSFMVVIASTILTRKKAYWTHGLMNVEGDVGTPKLMEAIGRGVVISDFFDVFNCDSVSVLRPKMPKGFEMNWEGLNNEAYNHLGKEYDTLSDILDDQKLNCTEYIWKCLQKVPDADIWFHGLKTLIDQNHNLCPQMFYDCGSFEVVFEARR